MATESVVWDWILPTGLTTSTKLYTPTLDRNQSQPPVSSPAFILIDLCTVRWEQNQDVWNILGVVYIMHITKQLSLLWKDPVYKDLLFIFMSVVFKLKVQGSEFVLEIWFVLIGMQPPWGFLKPTHLTRGDSSSWLLDQCFVFGSFRLIGFLHGKAGCSEVFPVSALNCIWRTGQGGNLTVVMNAFDGHWSWQQGFESWDDDWLRSCNQSFLLECRWPPCQQSS